MKKSGTSETNPYTGTALTQRQERLAVRKRYAEIMARRGVREATFRETNTINAREARVRNQGGGGGLTDAPERE